MCFFLSCAYFRVVHIFVLYTCITRTNFVSNLRSSEIVANKLEIVYTRKTPDLRCMVILYIFSCLYFLSYYISFLYIFSSCAYYRFIQVLSSCINRRFFTLILHDALNICPISTHIVANCRIRQYRVYCNRRQTNFQIRKKIFQTNQYLYNAKNFNLIF